MRQVLTKVIFMWRPCKTLFLPTVIGLAIISALFHVDYAQAEGPPFLLPPANEINKLRSAILTTNLGQIYIELFPESAPWHVANFKYLADKGYYNGLYFHLYFPGYIIQGGAPDGKPNGGPGYTLPPEFSDKNHVPGILGMARLPDTANPERRSNGSQFHIILGNSRHMNGSYTVFGEVVQGMEVVNKLKKGDRIKELKVFVRE